MVYAGYVWERNEHRCHENEIENVSRLRGGCVLRVLGHRVVCDRRVSGRAIGPFNQLADEIHDRTIVGSPSYMGRVRIEQSDQHPLSTSFNVFPNSQPTLHPTPTPDRMLLSLRSSGTPHPEE